MHGFLHFLTLTDHADDIEIEHQIDDSAGQVEAVQPPEEQTAVEQTAGNETEADEGGRPAADPDAAGEETSAAVVEETVVAEEAAVADGIRHL